MSAIGDVDLRDWGAGEPDGLLLAAGEREPEGPYVVEQRRPTFAGCVACLHFGPGLPWLCSPGGES
jgi:hypothetical protein